MKKNKMYNMVFQTHDAVFQHNGIATSTKQAKEIYIGNGELIHIKEVTEDFPISENAVYKALTEGGFGETEAETITCLLRRGYENTVL